MMAVSAILSLYSCKEDTPAGEFDAPSIVWTGNEDFAPQELEEQMNVHITITAEAGIATFVVGVDSEVLDPLISKLNNGSTDMDLINCPEGLFSILNGVGIPTGESLAGQTEVVLDLSDLIPMIITVEGNSFFGTGELKPDSDHVFTVKITDKAGNSLEKSCTFHYTGSAQ